MEHFSDIGAAVIGSGFIGTVHIENLRRLGVEVRGVLGCDPERGEQAARAPRPAAGVPLAGGAAGGPRGRRRPRHLAQPVPLPAGQGDPRCRPARHLREAAGRDLRRVARAGAPGRGLRPHHGGQLQHPLLPAQPARPPDGPRRRAGRAAPRHRATTSRTGCSSTPTGTGASSRRRAAALRAVGDIGSHWIDLTNFITGLRVAVGHGRPLHVREGPPAAHGPGRDVLPGARRRDASPSR